MHLLDILSLVYFLGTCLVVNEALVSAERTLPPEAGHWDEPSAPRKLSARVISPNSVKLKWRDPDVQRQGHGQNESQDRMYIVGYGSPPANIPFQTFVTKQRRLTLVNLEPGVVYDVTVRVVTQALGPWSKVLKVTIDDKGSSTEVLVKKLKAKEVTPTSVLLTWQLYKPSNQMIESMTVTVEPSTRGQPAETTTLSGNSGFHVVRGLKPSTQYVFFVQPVTKFGKTKKAQIKVETKSNVPARPPKSLRLRILNSTILSVRWQSPPLKSRNGPLIGYKIQYKRQGAKKNGIVTITISKNVRVYRIEDLERGQTYKVRVSAFNKGGEGPYTKWKPVLVENQDGKHGKDEKAKDGDQRKKGQDGHEKKDDNDEKDRGMMEEEKEKGGFNTTEDLGPEVHGQNASKREMLNKTEDSLNETVEGPAEQSTGTTTLPRRTTGQILPPGGVRVLKVTATTVHLAWDAPGLPACCSEMAYRVEVRNLKDFSIKRTLKGDTKVLLTGLEPDTRYRAHITAIDTGSESQPSEPVDFQTSKAEPPEIKDITVTRAVLGRTVNLSCLADGEELAAITWLLKDANEFVNLTDAPWINIAARTDVRSSTLGHIASSSSLLLYNVTEEAERDFACLASNSAGSDQKIISLRVEVPPAILSKRGMHVMVGTAAQLECAVKGQPLPDVNWIHTTTGLVYRERDQPNRAASDYVSSVTEGEDVRRSFLVIERTSLSQGGTYTCVAVSDLGRTDAEVSLDVLVPPPPPVREIQALALSPSRVSVTWLPPLDYQYSIRYYQVSVQDAQRAQLGIIQTTRVRADLSNLLPNSTYYVGVTAATEHGLGDTGPEVKVVTLSNIGLEPANVIVETINSTSIQVNWMRPDTVRPLYIRGYNIYLKAWKDRQVKSFHVRGGEDEKFVIELGPANQYELRMSTLTTWGFEAFTAWSKVRKPQRKMPPRPARDVSVTSIKSKSLVVRWREPKVSTDPNVHPGSNEILAYKVGYSPADAAQNIRVEEITGNKRQLQLNGLEPETMYRIFVQALGTFGTSDSVYLNVKTKSLPPTMVLNPMATAMSSTKIHLRWSAPKRGPVTRYHIRYWRPGHKDKQSAWMSGNYRDYIAGSLRKNSNYRFEVIPYNGDVLGEGIVIFSNTLSDKPDGPPRQVKLLAVDASTFEATWSPPDPQTTNGKIVGYRLVLKAKNGRRVANFEVEANRRNFTFLNMKVSGGYKLRMAAVNSNGTGVFSQPVQISYNQETEIPAPPSNVKIIPSILALTVVWDEPEFTGSPTLGYIVSYGQFIPDVFRTVLENSQTRHIIKNLKPNSEYIVSVRSFNSIGESKPTFLLTRTKPVPLKPIPLESPLKLTVLAVSPTSLILTWIDPALIKYPTLDDRRFYQIRYSSIDGEAYSYINTSSSNLLLSGLKQSTVYETSVRVIRGNETSDWSHPAVNSTQQLVPGGPPTAIMTSAVPGKPKLLHLNWSEPAQPNGIIESYIIYLSADPSLDPNKWVILETHLRKVTIRKLTPYIPYYLKLQARNKAGYGPLSDLMVYVPPMDKMAQPTILSVSNINSNMSASITVSWKAPKQPKGPIAGYMIYYVKAEDNIYTDWMMQFEPGLDGVLSGLDFNTTYFIKVRARYSDFSGPFSDRVNYTTAEGSLLEGLESDGISKSGNSSNISTSFDMEMVQKYLKLEPISSPKHIPNKDDKGHTTHVKDETSPDNSMVSTTKDTLRRRIPNDDHSVHSSSRGGEHINDRNNRSSDSPTANGSPYNESIVPDVGDRNHIGNDRADNNNTRRSQTSIAEWNKRKVKGRKKSVNKNDDDYENGRRNNFRRKKDRKRKRQQRKRKEKRRQGKTRKFGRKGKENIEKDLEASSSTTFPPLSVDGFSESSPHNENHRSDGPSNSVGFEPSSSTAYNEELAGPRNAESSAGFDIPSTDNEDLQLSTPKIAM